MMNTRIKELADQAAVNDVAKNFNGEDYTVRMPSETWAREFAELIVQECIVQMEKESRNCSMLMSYPPQSSAIWDAKNNIRKHFGVE